MQRVSIDVNILVPSSHFTLLVIGGLVDSPLKQQAAHDVTYFQYSPTIRVCTTQEEYCSTGKNSRVEEKNGVDAKSNCFSE